MACLKLALLVAGLNVVLLSQAKPIVDPGLFVILGVKTCREGEGYCLLGLDCTLDEDFLPDDLDGHCDGLRNAFTPSAHFICCKYNDKNITTTPKTRKTTPTLDVFITSEATPTINASVFQDVSVISSSLLDLKPVNNKLSNANKEKIETYEIHSDELKRDDPTKIEDVVDVVTNVAKPETAELHNQQAGMSVKTNDKESQVVEMPVSSETVLLNPAVHDISVPDVVLVADNEEDHVHNNDWSPIIYTLAADDKDNIKEIELDVAIPVQAVRAPPQAREPVTVSVLFDHKLPDQGNIIPTDSRRI